MSPTLSKFKVFFHTKYISNGVKRSWSVAHKRKQMCSFSTAAAALTLKWSHFLACVKWFVSIDRILYDIWIRMETYQLSQHLLLSIAINSKCTLIIIVAAGVSTTEIWLYEDRSHYEGPSQEALNLLSFPSFVRAESDGNKGRVNLEVTPQGNVSRIPPFNRKGLTGGKRHHTSCLVSLLVHEVICLPLFCNIM